jgi:hypothetical protein
LRAVAVTRFAKPSGPLFLERAGSMSVPSSVTT